MKKITLLLLVVLVTSVTYSQNKTTRKMLAEIEGQWELDDNGNVSYTRIIEVPEIKSKDEIYNRSLNYFVYNYGSGKSVIQTQDKDLGRIVGKGLYKDVHVGVSLITTYVDCWHIVRVDVKEGRARIILTLTEYDKKIVSGNTSDSHSSLKVEESFPINPKAYQRTVMGKAFYKSHLSAIATLDALEKAIKEGNTSKELEKDKW
ncbi:DUF4468 domain-containing protein [Lacinutrix sp. C3R15]|uniref:DUF4468 domain-containing protein n=1 Tax=Flavobacteriaceae TaxID=49546 RepID=UPI001C091FEB|nr:MULTISPECIES: DUF4468 domain-containing protein [Flavobacteriaceae]MBU2940209.1 DUF4468 domain-containing protein [Lacinutrix sp. C3R15]MDO6623526.1 DUF4468 domain-containing protein [Oceanihabitans sp. 1_MG-2023]